MPDLFSPLTLGRLRLPNRIALGPVPSGCAAAGGFAGRELADFYARVAQGGAGLLVSEPLLALAPHAGAPHLGAYDDSFIPGLRQACEAAQAHGARVLLTVDAPTPAEPPRMAELRAMAEALVLAAWRAHAAGADGVMLTAAHDGLLHSLISPLRNQRYDAYGRGLEGRLRLALEVIEGVRSWLGRRSLLAFRMLADELAPGGMSLQDGRVLAKRLSAAGVQLIDVAPPSAGPQVARFPGWAIPLASSIKRIAEVPVAGSGLLGDPHLADSVIRDGSVDLVMLGGTLLENPGWPGQARSRLAAEGGA
jgi:2,4-dienoyl-CoA reductase-like NADH-dependent reductase (Old Yellow Enzyme family)